MSRHRSFFSDKRFYEETYLSALRKLKGRVLEIGFGKGKSLTVYDQASEVVAVEAHSGRVMYGNEVIRKHKLGNVRCIEAVAESLPFADHYFDAVCCSLVLCSVDDQRKAVAECYRVLRPGGKLLAYEHTLSDRPGIRAFQQMLAPVLRPISENCRMNNRPLELITEGGFQIDQTTSHPFYLEPRLMITASRPSS